jgi:hypothetical protein
MAAESPFDDTRLYLVRVWHGPCRFRASVRAVDEEAVRLFTAAADVAAFLADPADPAPVAQPPTSGGPDENPA